MRRISAQSRVYEALQRGRGNGLVEEIKKWLEQVHQEEREDWESRPTEAVQGGRCQMMRDLLKAIAEAQRTPPRPEEAGEQ